MIKALIPYLLDTATNGLTLGIGFPAARRAIFNVSFVAAAANTPTVTTVNFAAGVSSGDLAAITSGTTVARMIDIDGLLLCSGSGNLIFYGKAEVANSTAKFLDGGSVVAFQIVGQTV